MNRLTVERVKAAYALSNRKPVRSSWDDGRRGSCGVGAVMFAEIRGPWPVEFEDIAVRLGIPEDYLTGFQAGFDGGDVYIYGDFPGAYGEGYSDGQAAAEAMGLT